MASSTLFRARRVVDPVPVQRGSLSRENKHHSSFSDLAAAWENVGEAKSALEAAEARINEANAGLVISRSKERNRPDLPLQEIFSETQRYGRVTRYELQPGLYDHDAPLAPRRHEEERHPRRALDFPPNAERHGLQRRVTDHLHVLSPPSRDTRKPVINEGTIRNPHTALQSYASGPSYIDTAITTYSSSANDPSEGAPVVASSAIPEDHAVPTVGSVTSFEDSLEVLGISAGYREARPASSLGLKAANASKSEALARLKERIKKQKDRVSRSNPESVQGKNSPISLPGSGESQTETAVIDPHRNVLDIPVKISKRKVASAPAAPAYKGFSDMESNAPGSIDVKRKVKSKGLNTYNPETKYGIQRPQKPTQNGIEPRAKKGPAKVQRVLAPRRPTDVITTSSWRAGQQTVKRILGPTKKKKTLPPISRTQSSSSVESELSEHKSLNLQWKADNENDKNSHHHSVDDDSSGGSRRSTFETDQDMSPTEHNHMGDVNRQDKDLDAEPCKLLSEAETGGANSVDDNDLQDLKGSKVLSTEAKNILSDLELDLEESDVEIKQPVSEPKPKHSLLKKSPKKRRAAEQQEVVYPTQKVRHYDSNEVKKYMAKQIAERKKKLRDERLMKQKAVEERKKKLEELYSKQKKNLRNNLARQDKNTMGETYSKGQSDLRSIIHPFSHPGHQDHMERCSEDTGVSESDKENLDIASFRGLPVQSKSKTKHQIAGLDQEGSISSPFEETCVSAGSSENDLEAEEGENSKIPRVTSVSVTTRKLDERLSAYAGFPGGSFVSEQQRLGDGFASTSSSDVHPRSSSPDQAVQDRVESATEIGRVKHLNSPPRDDRIAAIKQTAAELKHRLESEARRLGINLQPTASLREDDRGLPPSLPTSERCVFRGALPGVGNVHEQADLNKELEMMSSAATTIQAAYRGHSVRQGLNWKLPSGNTLGSTVRRAPRYQNPAASGSEASESPQYSTAWDTVMHEEEKSMSEVGTLFGSGNLGIQSTPSQNSVRVDKFPNAAIPSLLESERRFDTKGDLSGCPNVARPLIPPWRISGGDSLSVINIFARKNPHVILTRCEGERESSDTAILQEGTTQRSHGAEDTVGVFGPVAELNQSEELLEQTLVAGSPDRGKEHDYEDDFTGSLDSEEKTQNESGKRTPSCDQNADETAAYSEPFVSPGTSRSENKTKSPNESLQSGSLSPTLPEGDLSHVSETAERSSVLSSIQRSPTQGRETPGSGHQFSPPLRPPPSVFIPGSELGSRISPGSLDKRLTAELNRLEYMEESVRQLTDVERTRSVSLAQQETVSLAQILKSKQLAHAREMENLRAKAREEALESARQLEEARRAAANAATGAAQKIARMRLETATAISDSADRLLKVQTEAARTTAELAKHVEEARTSAARTLMEVAQQQATDTRGVAAEAASAAAEAAVKSAMARFHEQQEQILQERKALRKGNRHGRQGDGTPDNYSSYTATEPTDSHSPYTSARSATDALDRSSRSPRRSAYTSDDFDSLRSSRQDKSASIQTASDLSVDRTASHSRTTPTASDPASRSGHDSSVVEGRESVAEGLDHSVAGSVVSDIALEAAEDESLMEALSGNSLQKTSDPRVPASPAGVDYTLTFEESVVSSHTATDDEIDYRMILPSESHRRRSLSKTGRRGSIGSDQGTVSYSSDDNQDSQDLGVDKALEEISSAPFSAEDSFSQFTSEMVRLMKEEEVRAKHQEGLLRLREKALKEKTRAEMAWLELQKQRHRDKGADDVMPSIRKRQRGVLMRLQAEQAEIKRLKAANRAASYERRLLLMQQEEIARLRNTTKRIRETVNTERTEHDGHNGETLKSGGKDDVERLNSKADVACFPEELEDNPADQSARSHSAVSEDVKTDSPTVTASVAEEFSPLYGSQESVTREKKRPLSEGESDEGSTVEGTYSAAKGSPTASDSTVMQKLKKLRSQSSERYLTQREQKLMKRRKEAESLLENKKKLLEWERRLDKEEDVVRNLLNEALSLDRTKVRTTSLTSEEDEHKERTGRVSASNWGSRSLSSKVSDKDRSPQQREAHSETLIKSDSRDREGSASESSVPEEMTLSARDKSRDESSVPEIDMKTQSQGSSIPEEIPEEYANDTFESVNSTVTPTHSTPVHGNFSFKRDSSPTVSRTSSKDEGSKSEEEASMTETSDHSDIESRVRRLKDQLELRKREVKRLYNERKRQRKAMLRAQEASLRKELQAVEMVISRTKAELNRPQVDSTRTNSSSIKQRVAPTKSDSSESIPTREVRYHLSRTSATSASRKITSPEKAVPLPSRSGSAAGGTLEAVDDDDTISSAPILQEGSSVSVKSQDSFPGKKEEVDEAMETNEPYAEKEATTYFSEKTDRSLSLSQDELSERKRSVRELNGLSYEFEETKTEEDLSLGEGSEIRTGSKASLGEASVEGWSRSLSGSLSGSRRQPSGSVRTSSAREPVESEVDTQEEVKAAEDLSASEETEIHSRHKESLPSVTLNHDDVDKFTPDVTDGLDESRDSRSEKSTRISERRSVPSEASEPSRVSERSRSSEIQYSTSFETTDSEGQENNETYITEQISAADDVTEREVAEVRDSDRDIEGFEKTPQERGPREIDVSKGEEKSETVSEVSEDILTDANDNSEIEEIKKAASFSKREKAETDSLKRTENEEQLPSYSADFEPSADHEGESGSVTPPVSYTTYLDVAESSVFEEQEKSERLKGQRLPLSAHLALSDRSASEGQELMEQYQNESQRASPSFLKEVSDLQQASDEESTAEEMREKGRVLQTFAGTESIFTNDEPSHSSARQDIERIASNEGKNGLRVDEFLPVVSSITVKPSEKRKKETDEETVERIAENLSTVLLKESMNCMTMLIEKRRRTAEVLSTDVMNTPANSRDEERKNVVSSLAERISVKGDEYTIPTLLQEDLSETEDILEHPRHSKDDSSLSDSDFRLENKEREAIANEAKQLRKDSSSELKRREVQGNAIVGKLSDALLKEAAAQMIAIMRSRQEKLANEAPSRPEGSKATHSSDEESPLASPVSNRFMAVHRFPEGLPKYAEETSPPPGSPIEEQAKIIDEKELAEKLDQLRRLHEHLDGTHENREGDEDDRLEFNVISNSMIELPSQDEEDDDEGFQRPGSPSFLFSVPHRQNEVSSLVTSSLSFLFNRKRTGLMIDNVSPPPEIIGDSEPRDDLEANSKRVYRRLVFDLSGSVLKELLTEEMPSHRPSWMKPKRRRKRRFLRPLQPLVCENDYLPVVEKQVLNFMGLGEAKPSLESVRRKTPLKAGKKDLVDAILIQELREEEPSWIDYDDDELAVKFQVADAIFESLLSETVMVMNAVQVRREARTEAVPSLQQSQM